MADDVAATIGWPTIAVNDAAKLVLWACAVYAADREWWELHGPSIRSAASRWTQIPVSMRGLERDRAQDFASANGLNVVAGESGDGLCRIPGRVNYGLNSGFQAMNLAWHAGARRLVLLGFDYKNAGRRSHYFGDHPAPLRNDEPKKFEKWIAHMDRLAADLAADGVEVVNCSRDTALTCFRRSTITEELCQGPTS